MNGNVEQVVARLQVVANPYNTIVQVVESDSQVYIFLNRPPQAPPDCPELLPIIESTLKLEFPAIETVNVFSRELGQEHSDWHTVLRLQLETPTNELSTDTQIDGDVASSIEEPQQSAENAVATQESQQQAVTVSDVIPLSSFCFSRNRKILESDLDRPSKEVSAIIINFHRWGKEQQIKLLQFLKKWFDGEDNSLSGLSDLSSEAQGIVESMQADKELQRSLRIWFSRYCYDPQKTIREISGDSPAERQAPKKAGAADPKATRSQDASSGKTYPSRIPQGTQTSRSSSHASANQPTETSTNPIAEIIQILSTALVASGLAFLVRDITLSAGIMGIVLFVVSIVSGFLSAFRKTLSAGIFLILEVICIGVIGGWSPIIISVTANLVGAIIALSIFAITWNDGRLITAKSLRMMIASLMAVMLSLLSAAWFQVIIDASNFQVSGTLVLPEKTYNINGGAVARLVVLPLPRSSSFGVLEITASSSPISDEQLKLLKAKITKTTKINSNELNINEFINEFLLVNVLVGYARNSDSLLLYFVSQINLRDKTLSGYQLYVFKPPSAGLPLTKISPIFETSNETDKGISVDKIDLKEGGQVSFSLKTSIEEEGTSIEEGKEIAEVDLKFNTRVLGIVRIRE